MHRYLPARFSWPVLTAPTDLETAATSAAGGAIAVTGGPELGLACELLLVEMHVDKALSLMQQQQQQQQRTSGGGSTTTASPTGSAPSVGAPSAAATTVTITTTPAPVTPSIVTDETSKKSESPTDGSGGGGGGDKAAKERLHQSPDSRRREAVKHLSAADGAMLLLEPSWFSFSARGIFDDNSPGGGGLCGKIKNTWE